MYKIYHIFGFKIGCTTNFELRIKKQGFTLEQAEILETHDDINKASSREKELQKLYGYKVDNIPYTASNKGAIKNKSTWNDNLTTEMRSANTKKQWIDNYEKMKEASKKGLKAASEASAKSLNRANLQLWHCLECKMTIKGAGAAGRHRKKTHHLIERISGKSDSV